MVRKKWDIDSARELFSSRGYELLEDYYINTKTKMRYKCPEHPEKDTRMNLDKMKGGRNCPYCAGRATASYDEVAEAFKKRGYILLEKEYKGTNNRMRYRCPEHPDKETKISYHCLKLGQGCPYCAFGNVDNRFLKKEKLTFLEVEKKFNDRGYQLLEVSYKNNDEKMRFRCPHHSDKALCMSVGHLDKGCECRYCAFEKRRGKGNPMWNGGVTDLKKYLRGLTEEWRKESLANYGYKCAVTGINKHLQVHHIRTFKDIFNQLKEELEMNEILKPHEYSSEELEQISETFLKIHNEQLGIPLNKETHLKFHNEFGDHTTIDDLWEFKERYLKGEFGKVYSTTKQLTLI